MIRLDSIRPARASLARPASARQASADVGASCRRIRSPASPDFSGWNCTAETLSRSTAALKRHAVLATRRGVGGDRRRIGMREIDLRSLVDAGHQSCRPRQREGIPANMWHFQPGPFTWSGSEVKQVPLTRQRPSTPGASLLPSNSHCRPTQMPSNGVPSSTIVLMAVRHSAVEGAGGVEVADAGHDDAVRAAELAGDRRRPHLRADRVERLSHRRQIAGAVVDQCDHSRPLVLGSVRARRLSFEHAMRSARANALKHASILW